MTSFRLLAALVLLFAGIQPSPAQNDDAAEPANADTTESRKQYQVEIATFHYLGPDSSAGEDFNGLVISEYFPEEPFDIEEYQRVRENVRYTELVHLAEPVERLRASPQYAVMTAQAWVQPLLDKEEAIDVPLGGVLGDVLGDDPGGVPGAEPGSDSGYASQPGMPRRPPSRRVNGSLRVYGDYLLFVDLDISAALPRSAFTDLEESSEQLQQGVLIPRVAGEDRTGLDTRQSAMLHLSERRRIKLEEFHYFDHPYFGAIVSVTRYEGPPVLSTQGD